VSWKAEAKDGWNGRKEVVSASAQPERDEGGGAAVNQGGDRESRTTTKKERERSILER
jgi:hypothetical protein